MSKKTIRDRRLTGENSLTNVLAGQGGAVSEDPTQPGITGTPEDGTGTSVKTTTSTQAGQQQAGQQNQQKPNIATKTPKQPARSGMFTNIKQFLEKNKPAVQQMGEQAGRQFATTAEKVKEQAKTADIGYQRRLQESQEAIGSQLTGGQQAIETALQAAPGQSTTPAEDITTPTEQPEQRTLSDYAKQAEELAASTSSLNLQDQIKKAEQLQKQSQGILTDAGRRDLLKDVFGRGTRQYTSGSQALDNLLLAADPRAGQRLEETIQTSARGLEDVSRRQQAAAESFQALKQRAGGVGDILEKQSEQALQQQFEDASDSQGGYLQQRSGILGDIIAGANKQFQDIYKNLQYNYIDNDRYLTQKSENPDTISYNFNENLYDQYNLDKLGYDRAKFDKIIKDYMPRSLYKYKSTKGEDLYNDDPGHNNDIWVSGKERREQNKAVDTFKAQIENYLNEGMSPEMQKVDGLEINPYALSAINSYLTGQGQASLSDLLAGSDIDPEKFYGFSAENAARINALKRLRGEAEVLPSENYFRLEDLQNLLGNKGGYELENLYDDILYPYLNPDRPRS